MCDKIVEFQREINDKFNEGEKGELKTENKQLEGGNEILMARSSLQNSAVSTISPSLQLNDDIIRAGKNNIIDDDALEEAELFVPNWLIEVLAFIIRKEMANSSLSTASKIFKLLCWPKLHQKVKPHKLPNLISFYNRDNGRAEFSRIDTNEVIPIVSSPAPPYIDGIGKIELSFVNEQIVQFIKSIDNLIQSCDLCVYFKFISHQVDKKRIASMHTLMEFLATKIVKFTIITNYVYAGNPVNDFNVMFPGILDQIQMLSFYQPLKIFEFNILMNWLTKQTNDGKKQKIIQFHDNQGQDCLAFINRIKQEFSASNSPANFLISFAEFFEPYQRIEDFDDDEDEFVEFYQNVEEFTLENERTNEILASYRRQNCYHQFFIARYPKGEEYWKEEGEKKIQKAPWPSTLSDDPSIVIEA